MPKQNKTAKMQLRQIRLVLWGLKSARDSLMSACKNLDEDLTWRMETIDEQSNAIQAFDNFVASIRRIGGDILLRQYLTETEEVNDVSKT